MKLFTWFKESNSLGHLDTSFGLARVTTIPNLSDICTESLRAEIVINEDTNKTFRLLWKGHSQLREKCIVTREDYKAKLLFFFIKNLLDKRKYTYLSKGKSNKLLFLFTFTDSNCVYIIGTRISKAITDESTTEAITAEEYICKEDDIFSIPIDELNTYNFEIKLCGREYKNVLVTFKLKLVKKSQDKDGLPIICFEIIKSISRNRWNKVSR